MEWGDHDRHTSYGYAVHLPSGKKLLHPFQHSAEYDFSCTPLVGAPSFYLLRRYLTCVTTKEQSTWCSIFVYENTVDSVHVSLPLPQNDETQPHATMYNIIHCLSSTKHKLHSFQHSPVNLPTYPICENTSFQEKKEQRKHPVKS